MHMSQSSYNFHVLVKFYSILFIFIHRAKLLVFWDIDSLWDLDVPKIMVKGDAVDGQVVDILPGQVGWEEQFDILIFIPLQNFITSVLIRNLPSLRIWLSRSNQKVSVRPGSIVVKVFD